MSAAARAVVVDAEAAQLCAAGVLDVVPQVMDAVRHAMRQHVGGQLTIPQFRCLNHIASSPGASIGSVAGFMGVTMPTASAMVDRLLKAGMVTTRVALADRRRVELQITSIGKGHLARIRGDAQVELVELLGRCSPSELLRLQDGLTVMRSIFAQHRPSATP